MKATQTVSLKTILGLALVLSLAIPDAKSQNVDNVDLISSIGSTFSMSWAPSDKDFKEIYSKVGSKEPALKETVRLQKAIKNPSLRVIDSLERDIDGLLMDTLSIPQR